MQISTDRSYHAQDPDCKITSKSRRPLNWPSNGYRSSHLHLIERVKMSMDHLVVRSQVSEMTDEELVREVATAVCIQTRDFSV